MLHPKNLKKLQKTFKDLKKPQILNEKPQIEIKTSWKPGNFLTKFNKKDTKKDHGDSLILKKSN